MMNKSLEIKFHFQRTMPVFKRKHGSPVQPEGRIKYFLIKHILYGLIIKILILCHKELHDLHAALLTEIKFAVSMCILATIYCCTAQRIVRVLLVQPVKFIQNRSSRYFQRRNASEQIPQTFKMIFHLAATAHHISSGCIINSIACATGNVHCLQNMDVRAGHLSIPYQEAGCCQSRKTTSNNVGIFILHTLRLFRPCKCLIISVRIINSLTVFLVFSPFCIAVLLPFPGGTRFLLLSLIFRFSVLFYRNGSCPGSCRNCCHANSKLLFCCHSIYHLSSVCSFLI